MTSTGTVHNTVGVIGLGAMGLPIAINLAKHGLSVHGCDVSEERRASLVAAGGHAVAQPAELPKDCTVYFVILPNPPITELALFGESGLAGPSGPLSENDIVINLGTIGPDALIALAKRLEERGARVLDVPMGKSSVAAAEGNLSLMVSGDDSTLAEVRSLFDNIASEILYCGNLGIASTIKIVNNLVSATIADVVGQALVLGVAAGAPFDVMIKVLSSTGADNWHVRNTFAHHVSKRDFKPGFSVDLATKDLKIGLDMAAQRHIPLPTVAQAHQRYLDAQSKGFGAEDWGAMAKIAEASAGVELGHDGGEGSA